jgi:hypothetical protein
MAPAQIGGDSVELFGGTLLRPEGLEGFLQLAADADARVT